MSPRRRRPRRAFLLAGIGVHAGKPGRVEVAPAAFGTGLRWRRPGGADTAVHLAFARVGPGRTELVAADGDALWTPEHLLAALVAHGVTDAWLEATGPEVPLLDGSAAPWAAGLAENLEEGPELAPLALAAPVRVAAGEAWAEAVPAGALSLHVAFALPGCPSAVAVPPDALATVLAARTFVRRSDIAAALAAGRGAGANAENTVVWGEGGAEGPLRTPDEPVRHKALDLLGDLALLGAPLAAAVSVHRGTHALHHALVAAILASDAEFAATGRS